MSKPSADSILLPFVLKYARHGGVYEEEFVTEQAAIDHARTALAEDLIYPLAIVHNGLVIHGSLERQTTEMSPEEWTVDRNR